MTRYTYNERAFNDDSEECYYFLGFISADGCLSDRGSLRINISKKDVEILNKLKKYLMTEKPIYNVKLTNSVLLEISNKTIYKNLLNFGITPKKSLTNTFPKNIPEEKIRHFIRGYFDGDGCVSIKKGKNTLRLRINMVGTNEFLNSMQKILIQSLDISNSTISNINEGKNTYQFNIQKKLDIQKIKNYFYHDSHIFLQRKKEIFLTNVENKINNGNTTSKYRNVFFRKKSKWGFTYYKEMKRFEKSGYKTEEDAYQSLCKIKNGHA